MIVPQSIAELDLCIHLVTDDRHFAKLACECELALQAELAAQAAGKQQAVGDLQEQVGRLQDLVARAQHAPSPAHTRLHTYIYKAVPSS